MSATPRTIARAEGVGSLLRTPAIVQKIGEIYGESRVIPPQSLPSMAGHVAELAALVDEAVPAMVERQIEAGLDVVTDGEIARHNFLGSFFEAVDGLAVADVEHGYSEPRIGEGGLRKARNPLALEAASMRSRNLGVPWKVTVPPPSYFLWALPQPESGAFNTTEAFLAGIEGILTEIVAEAVAAGATWIQFDAPIYSIFTDPNFGPPVTEEGMTQAIEADQRVLATVPAGITTATHLCRGNDPKFQGSGALDAVAERMFNELAFDRWLVEWERPDDHGDFSPLRFVPKGPTVVLGIVSTKTPELESEDAMVAKIEEASQYLDVDQLAVSPQCGFASINDDHNVDDEAHQWAKLELVGRIADRVWPR
jgi:5-methyltetrahydropteroyltriglutamate--homocysteine methyltransferase